MCYIICMIKTREYQSEDPREPNFRVPTISEFLEDMGLEDIKPEEFGLGSADGTIPPDPITVYDVEMGP